MAGANLEGQLISQVKLDPWFETMTLQMMKKLSKHLARVKIQTRFLRSCFSR